MKRSWFIRFVDREKEILKNFIKRKMQYFVIIVYYLITIPLYFPLIVSSLCQVYVKFQENIEKTNEIFYFFSTIKETLYRLLIKIYREKYSNNLFS